MAADELCLSKSVAVVVPKDRVNVARFEQKLPRTKLRRVMQFFKAKLSSILLLFFSPFLSQYSGKLCVPQRHLDAVHGLLFKRRKIELIYF